MIRISRPPLETIPELGAWRYVAAKSTAVLAAYHQRGDRRGPNFKPAIWHQARSVLVKIFRSKCAACRVAPGRQHLRGRDSFQAQERGGRRQVLARATGGWPTIWDNLFILLPRCNQMKGARFPIDQCNARLVPGDDLSNEGRIPAQSVRRRSRMPIWPSTTAALSSGRTERGRITIEIYGLNREKLVAARRRAIIKQAGPVGK